jgi:hypothetical protein
MELWEGGRGCDATARARRPDGAVVLGSPPWARTEGARGKSDWENRRGGDTKLPRACKHDAVAPYARSGETCGD